MALHVDALLRRNAAIVPSRPAASLGERVLTFAALDAAASRLAHALAAQGVRRGDRVVTWADTSLDVLELFAATSRLGAVLAPLNARYGPDEAALPLGLARPKILVADGERAAAAAALAGGVGVPLLRLGDAPGPGNSLGAEAGRASAAPYHDPALSEADPHVLFFTSGSTGSPKGVSISHRANYLRTFHGVFRDEPERSVCMFPLFHMAGFTLALSAWQTRGELALVTDASAEAILATAERRRATRLYCIPAIWARVLDTDTSRFDTSSLKELDTGTSATPIELIRALKERFPATATRIYYGSTEVGAGTTLPDADVLRKPGSVGPASPGVDLKLSDAGEICLRSDYIMDGYFDDPDATAAALREGWFHTGDLGVLDDEGYLSIVGRLKEIIRTGGESVAPAEVEEVLAAHPSIHEVAVVGLPDARWGEIVCAVVVARGTAPDLDAIQRHCERRLAGFKKPRRLEVVDALPRTAATGQVQRTLIVQQLESRASGGQVARTRSPSSLDSGRTPGSTS